MKNRSSIKSGNILFGLVLISIILVGLYTTISQFNNDVLSSEIQENVIIDQDIYITDSIGEFPAEGSHCLTCHEGIEPTRPHSSKMMQEIYSLGQKVGDPNGCVVCHGGDPTELIDKSKAHSAAPKGNAQSFYTPVPGALNVNNNTCALCHEDHTYNAHRSIMNTDAGKIKAITWSWGVDTENKDHIYGNTAIDDPDGATPRFGSETYKGYMLEMAEQFPGQFPSELKEIPQADLSTLTEMPEQAAFTYLRNCNYCHINGKGGSSRGMGCAACHSLYSKQRYYEGGDKSIPKDERGHLLVHSMQGSRKSPIHINGKRITGIQTSTCATCHSSGRRIGLNYQGFMSGQYIKDDAHQKVSKDGKMMSGLSCQDCHTTTSMHGNGNIGSTTLATIEIECADCHGTPNEYPWELPIGYGDEFGRKIDKSQPRSLASEPEKTTREFGVVYPKHDGYLLTTRGNAFGNVIRDGNDVWVYTDKGLKVKVPVLKNIHNDDSWQHAEKAKGAMVSVPKHLESLECYACHAMWAPQYYEYRYTIDYSKDGTDWAATSANKQSDGTSGEYHGDYVSRPGRTVSGGYSYSRWDNLALGINGEGRVSPLTGVIQTVGSVIDTSGNYVAYRRVAETTDSIKAIELQPVQPHTISLDARDCADCHGNPKAIGYGLDNGMYNSNPSLARYTDVVDLHGESVSEFTTAQVQGIKDMHNSFSKIISKDGKQLITVDSHWELSSPLTQEQRDKLDRNGTCMACHQDTPGGSIPMAMLEKIAHITNMSFADGESHAKLLNQNNVLIAWIKFLGIIGLLLLPFICVAIYIYRAKILLILRSLKSKMNSKS